LPSGRISKTKTPLTHFHSNFPVDFEFIIRSEPGIAGTFFSKFPAAGTAVTRQTNGTASEMPPDRQIASFKCGMAQGEKAAPKCPAMKQQAGL